MSNSYNNEDKTLQKYLNEIASFPTLSREKEQILARKAKEGDKSAINKLIESNLKFVVRVAAKYQNRGLSLSELISEGNIGLIKAIQKFDPDKDFKLISYGVWWIKQRIVYAIYAKKNIIRLPLGKVNTFNKIKSTRNKIYNKTGNQATSEEIMKNTDLDKKTFDKLLLQSIDTITMDDPEFSHKSDSLPLKDLIQDHNISNPKEIYYKEKLIEKLHDSIEDLPSRATYIIKSYYGLDGSDTKNFAQIADEIGLSRERVRQIQKDALEIILKKISRNFEDEIDTIINSFGG